ncbi:MULTISPECIES: hypothetical protein [unclassified Sphingobacterium]|uniref:hypothetical protein n=1 Tax=unclassified Sphingobacterium TaxID=2609468 RepID=UPI0025E1FCB8|nr:MULTISPECIES: hypothetical protein [unclassified Sphingobacterium]
MANKQKPLGISVQAGMLKSMFPKSSVTNKRDKGLIWKHKIQPSPLSDQYVVKLEYDLGKPPRFYVVDPLPLPLSKNAKKLPHVYDQKKQRLCLYYPDGKQWNSSMPLAKTVVLWAYEWLYHYELWLGSDDDWKGGGVHPYKNQTKIDNLN